MTELSRTQRKARSRKRVREQADAIIWGYERGIVDKQVRAAINANLQRELNRTRNWLWMVARDRQRLIELCRQHGIDPSRPPQTEPSAFRGR